MIRSIALGLVLAALALAFPLAFLFGALAQDGRHGQGHADRHDWYNQLFRPLQPWASCCNAMTAAGDGDCRPVRAVERDGAWYAHFPGEGWVEVPREVILPDDLNREPLQAHACRSKTGTWHCFLRKSGGT